jgi:hypothetical protein
VFGPLVHGILKPAGGYKFDKKDDRPLADRRLVLFAQHVPRNSATLKEIGQFPIAEHPPLNHFDQ